MALCPNRRRKSRVHKGGGKVGCQGTLRVKVLAPLVFSMNRWPKRLDAVDVFNRSLFAPIRRYGRRITAREILATIQSGRWNLECPTCGWTLKTPTAARGC
jgi:hypothetical protein